MAVVDSGDRAGTRRTRLRLADGRQRRIVCIASARRSARRSYQKPSLPPSVQGKDHAPQQTKGDHHLGSRSDHGRRCPRQVAGEGGRPGGVRYRCGARRRGRSARAEEEEELRRGHGDPHREPIAGSCGTLLQALRYLRWLQVAGPLLPQAARVQAAAGDRQPGAIGRAHTSCGDTDHAFGRAHALPQQTGVHLQQQQVVHQGRDRHTRSTHRSQRAGLPHSHAFRSRARHQ